MGIKSSREKYQYRYCYCSTRWKSYRSVIKNADQLNLVGLTKARSINLFIKQEIKLAPQDIQGLLIPFQYRNIRKPNGNPHHSSTTSRYFSDWCYRERNLQF